VLALRHRVSSISEAREGDVLQFVLRTSNRAHQRISEGGCYVVVQPVCVLATTLCISNQRETLQRSLRLGGCCARTYNTVYSLSLITFHNHVIIFGCRARSSINVTFGSCKLHTYTQYTTKSDGPRRLNERYQSREEAS
jgi:hypothetical protein